MLSAISDINPQASTNFKYDARNRQVSRVVNGAATFYIYDNWNLLEEYTANVTPEVAYLHGVGIDKLISKKDSQNITVYYHHDALGNVVALSNTSGALVERYRYDLFGYPLIQNASASYLGSSAYNNRFLFTGREWLAALNIYDYRNRQYSPHIGRFLQTDPIRFDAEDVNLYRYVGNNPVNWVDPFGLEIYTTNDLNPDQAPNFGILGALIHRIDKVFSTEETAYRTAARMKWIKPCGNDRLLDGSMTTETVPTQGLQITGDDAINFVQTRFSVLRGMDGYGDTLPRLAFRAKFRCCKL